MHHPFPQKITTVTYTFTYLSMMNSYTTPGKITINDLTEQTNKNR